MKPIVFILILVAGLCLHGQEVAFSGGEKDLIPEGIACDPRSGDFFVSSIFRNKIVRISKDNQWSDFIASQGDGFAGGVGLHVDPRRGILWACSGNVMGERFRTGLFAYDLRTKKLIKKIFCPTGTTKRFFNDLAIDDRGSVYVTDTYGHAIWRWDLSLPEPVKLVIKGKIEYPNGIAISPDNKFLFVTSNEGLKRVTLAGNAVELLPMPQGSFTSTGLDGIAFFKNSLFAVQNGSGKSKIIRYYLSKAFDKIEKIKLIDMDNKHFDIPTTLTVANGCLYVLANSQLLNLDQEKIAIIRPESLTATVILKYRLE